MLDVASGRSGEKSLVWCGVRRVAAQVAPFVEQPVMCDDQGPRAELGLASAEAGEVPCDLEEYLAGQVLRLPGAPAPQVAEHKGGDIAVERRPSPLGPRFGGLQHLEEA